MTVKRKTKARRKALTLSKTIAKEARDMTTATGTATGTYDGKTHISGFAVKSQDGAIFKPSLDPSFFVKDEDQEMMESFEELSKSAPQNLILTGPQGSGKTELCIYYAAKYERPCFIMNCATIREAREWLGYRDAKEGSLFWHRSEFVRAVEHGNCVIVLDEINRLHATLHNALYPLLDARRSSFLEEIGEVIRVAPNTVFMATANIGYSHTGTHTLDSAFEDRFAFRIDVEFPSEEKEADIIHNKTGVPKVLARKLAKFASDIRRKAVGAGATLSRAVSTRQLLNTAVLMKEFEKKGKTASSAINFTVLPYYSKDGGKDSEQAQVLQLVQGLFGA